MLFRGYAQKFAVCEMHEGHGKRLFFEEFLFHFRNVDYLHDLMDEELDQQELSTEISEAISSPMGFGVDTEEVTGTARIPCIPQKLLTAA